MLKSNSPVHFVVYIWDFEKRVIRVAQFASWILIKEAIVEVRRLGRASFLFPGISGPKRLVITNQGLSIRWL